MIKELVKWIDCGVIVTFNNPQAFSKQGVLDAVEATGIVLRQVRGQRQTLLFCIPFTSITTIKFATKEDAVYA